MAQENKLEQVKYTTIGGTEDRSTGASTLAVHGNRQKNPYHSLIEPVVHTSTYIFDDTDDLCEFKELHLRDEADGREEYARYGNPTVRACELRLAALEGSQDAILYPTGMAAITMPLLSLLSAGSHVIFTEGCYKRTRHFAADFLSRLGISATFVSMCDEKQFEKAIQKNTRLFFSETPTNPYLRVLDLDHYAAIAKNHGILTMIDTTFATPLNLRPLEWGWDLVIHSATKYLGGHNDLLSGVVCGSYDQVKGLREANGVLGAVPDPGKAAQLLRGVKTLALRVRHQNEGGQRIADFLESHPDIEKVWYPGLPSHPDYKTAKKQMAGFGGVVTFQVRGDLKDTARFIDALRIPKIGPSLGGTEALVGQVPLLTYYDHSPAERLEQGIPGNLVRYSLGIEDSDDLIADLAQALDQV